MMTTHALELLAIEPDGPYTHRTDWQAAIADHPYTSVPFYGHVTRLVELRDWTKTGGPCPFPGILDRVTENLGRIVIEHGKTAVETELDRLIVLKQEHDMARKKIWAEHADTRKRIDQLIAADPEFVRVTAAGHMLWMALQNEDEYEEGRGLRAEAGMHPGPSLSLYRQAASNALADFECAADLVRNYFETPDAYNTSGTIRQIIARMIASGRDWPVKGWQMAKEHGIEDV